MDLRARLDDAFRWVSDAGRSCPEAPVFIFSAGWRSGSTLLQRMLMQHNDDIVIWGEPYHLSNIFESMVGQFRAFTVDWPKKKHFLSKKVQKNLADQWIANLYPDVDYLLNAHRSFLYSLFGEPAKTQGYSRWGVKEVRLTIDHARYVRALYPNARIIFLCRNPLESYRSFFKVYDAWFEKWPDTVVATPYAFGRHWAKLTEGYVKNRREVDAFFIKYETLDSAQTVEQLAQYLGWTIPRASSLARIVGENTDEVKPKVPWLDGIVLGQVTASARRLTGY